MMAVCPSLACHPHPAQSVLMVPSVAREAASEADTPGQEGLKVVTVTVRLRDTLRDTSAAGAPRLGKLTE